MDRQAAIEYVRKLSPVDPNDPYIEQLQTCVHCDQPGTKDRPLLRESMDTSDSRGIICVPVAVHGDCHLVAHTSGHEGLCTFPADQEPTPRARELRARFEEDPAVRAMLETFGGELSNVKRPGGTNEP